MHDVRVRDYKFYMRLHWKEIPLPPPSMPFSPSVDRYVEFSLENFLNKPVPGLVYDTPYSPTRTDAFTQDACTRRYGTRTTQEVLDERCCVRGRGIRIHNKRGKRPHTECSLGAANVQSSNSSHI